MPEHCIKKYSIPASTFRGNQRLTDPAVQISYRCTDAHLEQGPLALDACRELAAYLLIKKSILFFELISVCQIRPYRFRTDAHLEQGPLALDACRELAAGGRGRAICEEMIRQNLGRIESRILHLSARDWLSFIIVLVNNRDIFRLSKNVYHMRHIPRIYKIMSVCDLQLVYMDVVVTRVKNL